MSAPLDVLTILDRAINCATYRADKASDLRAARAAFAELIAERDEAVRSAQRMEAREAKAHEIAQQAEAERDALRAERDAAIEMLAGWCVAVDENGTGWDDWDEHYKDAMYRSGPLRGLLDAAIDNARGAK